MNKALYSPLFIAGIALASQPAQATDNYIGIMYNMYTFSGSDLEDMEPEGFTINLAGALNDNFLIEGRLGHGISDDNANGTALKIGEYIGFYVKGGMDFANMIFPYAIIGYSKVDVEVGRQSPPNTESDISYGIGADLHFGHFQVGLEWMTLLDESDYKVENLGLSAAYRF